MDTIIYPVLGISHVSPNDFVRFWDQMYFGFDEGVYQDNINQPLTEERIVRWFEWKNGMRLSANKLQTVRRNFTPKELIGHDADARTLSEFLNRPGGAIWRIFWLHLQHPLYFPIFDQHVHRAMAILLKWPEIDIPNNDPTKIRTYLDSYCPFFKRFDGCEHRKIDRALWSFGEFLGQNRDRTRLLFHG